MKKISNEKLFNILKILNEMGIEISYSHRNNEENFKRIILVGIRGSKFTNGIQPEDYQKLKKGFSKSNKIEFIEIKDDLENPVEMYFLPSLNSFKKLLKEVL